MLDFTPNTDELALKAGKALGSRSGGGRSFKVPDEGLFGAYATGSLHSSVWCGHEECMEYFGYFDLAMMQKITATGCSLTALVAAFFVVDQLHALETTASVLSIFGIAGKMGMDAAKGPASLRTHLIDSLYGLDEASVIS